MRRPIPWMCIVAISACCSCSQPQPASAERMTPASPVAPVPQTRAIAADAAPRHHLQPLPACGRADAPLILLEAEAAAAGSEAGLITLGGEVEAVAGARAEPATDALILHHQGTSVSQVTIGYRLPEDLRPGTYAIWTAFTLGGIARQDFTVGAGPDGGSVRRRAAFVQGNAASWKTVWQRAEPPLLLLAGDRRLTVTIAGAASQRKILDALLLEPLEPAPGMSATGGWLRAQALGREDAAAVRNRVIVLDDLVPDGGPALERLLPAVIEAPDAAGLAVRYLPGTAARRYAEELGIGDLPAIVVADDRHRLRGVADAGTSTELLRGLLAGEAASLPMPRSSHAEPEPRPFRDGMAAEWLAAGCWAGPCGASLTGIDAERSLRPSAGDPCTAVQFDTALPGQWRILERTATGGYVIASPVGDFTWPRGSAMACLYLKADSATQACLALSQSGIQTMGWLDGAPLAFSGGVPAAASGRQGIGRTDQGNDLPVSLVGPEGPVQAHLALGPGWHRLVLKLVMQHRAGETFRFQARFTDSDGRPLAAVGCIADPEQDAAGHAIARRLVPYLRTSSPADLPRVGDAMRLAIDFRCVPRPADRAEPLPVPPLPAQVELTLTGYDGQEVARRLVQALLPGRVEADFGPARETGYHAVHIALRTPDGRRRIASYAPDGFSVIAGAAAQRERRTAKKAATTYYFLSHHQNPHQGGTCTDAFRWMDRMGVLRNVGSSPGFDAALWEEARRSGIELTADFWDIHNGDAPEAKERLARSAAAFGRGFKSFNEIDISPRTKGTPEQWVARSRVESRAVHMARADGIYVGGSLVRPGKDPWFEACLRLGLDELLDAWDVHAYPQLPPRLGGAMSNSDNESEPGVLAALARAGKTNRLPFWMGETGARACHGLDARRWQAGMIAKMLAWANSRADFQVIGFLIPFCYSRNTPTAGEGDIQFAHHPAEAALYTASALIDGLPFTDRSPPGSPLCIGLFGNTWMMWSTGGVQEHRFAPGFADPVRVDAVGRVASLPRQADGSIAVAISTDPVYVLEREEYRRLTRE